MKPVDRDHWIEDALCRGLDAEVFFPVSTADNKYREAKLICRQCKVKKQCLSLVIHLPDHDDKWGVFGGLDPHERNIERDRR